MAKRESSRIQLYGLSWPRTMLPVAVEMEMVKHGGQWTTKRGQLVGNGLYYHMRRGQELLWPHKKWHKWNELELQMYVKYRYIGEMGCAAAGKSDTAASNVLFDWYCLPYCTTVLVTSTSLEALEVRAWGMIKAYHKAAKQRYPWISGHLIEGKRRIVLDDRSEFAEGRDFKNGLMAVATLKGNQWVGLGPLIGIHNKRVRLLCDEAQLMPRAYLDSTANLSKCEDFKLNVLGNPNETTNAHGMVCEPHESLGGWEGGIDQRPGTKTWKTRFPDGICIQLPGSDSPNMDVPEGQPVPFPFLMTRQQMQDDAKIWGVDDWHFTMMNEAKMPRGQGSCRVITRQMCEKFGAMKEPIWRDSNRTKIFWLDAAYRGVGGDRCTCGEVQFGLEAESDHTVVPISSLVVQNGTAPQGRMILALIDAMIIPITAEKDSDQPEDQIVAFVKAQCEHRGIPPEHFFFDAGMRTTLVTAFSRLWSPLVESIDFGGRPSESMVSREIQIPCDKYYSKRVTELWYMVRMIIESRQFRGMTQEVMWEGCAREFKRVQGNKIEVESKADMKLKCGRSPDLFDGLACGVWGARKLGFIVSKLQPPVDPRHPQQTPDWKRKLQQQASDLWRSKELEYST